ncbi:hypothetical protein ACFX2I_003289 [Malus domestica]
MEVARDEPAELPEVLLKRTGKFSRILQSLILRSSSSSLNTSGVYSTSAVELAAVGGLDGIISFLSDPWACFLSGPTTSCMSPSLGLPNNMSCKRSSTSGFGGVEFSIGIWGILRLEEP